MTAAHSTRRGKGRSEPGQTRQWTSVRFSPHGCGEETTLCPLRRCLLLRLLRWRRWSAGPQHGVRGHSRWAALPAIGHLVGIAAGAIRCPYIALRTRRHTLAFPSHLSRGARRAHGLETVMSEVSRLIAAIAKASKLARRIGVRLLRASAIVKVDIVVAEGVLRSVACLLQHHRRRAETGPARSA